MRIRLIFALALLVSTGLGCSKQPTSNNSQTDASQQNHVTSTQAEPIKPEVVRYDNLFFWLPSSWQAVTTSKEGVWDIVSASNTELAIAEIVCPAAETDRVEAMKFPSTMRLSVKTHRLFAGLSLEKEQIVKGVLNEDGVLTDRSCIVTLTPKGSRSPVEVRQQLKAMYDAFKTHENVTLIIDQLVSWKFEFADEKYNEPFTSLTHYEGMQNTDDWQVSSSTLRAVVLAQTCNPLKKDTFLPIQFSYQHRCDVTVKDGKTFISTIGLAPLTERSTRLAAQVMVIHRDQVMIAEVTSPLLEGINRDRVDPVMKRLDTLDMSSDEWKEEHGELVATLEDVVLESVDIPTELTSIHRALMTAQE